MKRRKRRKKKRRRKLPKTSSFRSSRGVQIRRCGQVYSPRPCYVRVIMQLQFQQFKVHVSMKVPQIQFIDRVLDRLSPRPSLCNDSSWSGQCRWRAGSVQFLDKVIDVPVVCNVRCWRDSAQNCGGLRSCSSSASWSDVYGGLWMIFSYFLRDGEHGSGGRFSLWKSGFPRAPCIWQSLSECSYVSHDGFWKNFIYST